MARRPPDPSPLGGLGTALFSLWLLVNLTTLPANAQQQPNQQQQNQKHHQNTPQLNRAASFSSRSDTRALIPFAPDERLNRDAVRAPAHPARRATGGLSSRIHPTRSLQDWKVEDVVLLATVDGMIHASDRNTGTELWYLEADNPMVETVYHARNRSVDGRGEATPNDFLWIVEPSEDGALYGYTPGTPFGMQKLGFTVKQLVDEVSGSHLDESPVVYTGEKSSTLYTVDIATGNILKWFSPRQSVLNDQGICRQGAELDALDDEKCGATGSLTLTRTEYIVGIQSSATGEQISTIKYSEWGPNKRDQDLFNQYSSTKDNRYIHSRHNGEILALLSSGSPDTETPMYRHKFESPVARVFDVARPLHSDALDTPLVLLPQPLNPSYLAENHNVFVNCTEAGSWYAMSEATYPLVTQGAAEAKCTRKDWLSEAASTQSALESQLKEGLVGVHHFTGPEDIRSIPLLSPSVEPPALDAGQNQSPILAAPNGPVVAHGVEQPYYVGGYLPIFTAIVCLVLVYIAGSWNGRILKHPLRSLDKALPSSILNEKQLESATPKDVPIANNYIDAVHSDVHQATELTVIETAKAEAQATTADTAEPSPPIDGGLERTPSEDTPKPKKKAHRGKRGGKREAEKRALKGPLEDGAVDGAIEIKPDIVYQSSSNSTEVPVGLLNLEIQSDQILGQGSGGTIVFAGKFEGRDVAVKRMLGQYSELASQEVSLLEQSEDHPNVIRYFCRRQDEHFLYIALELCQASLWDLFRDGRPEEVPEKYNDLLNEIRQRPDKVLRQLADGLKHLHNFRIVHRDIKPQNMLIAYPKSRTTSTFPRLVISDFGLCKTLPENVSTLIGATFSAGTTGWKAPELIFQPKDILNGSSHSTGRDSTSGDPAYGVKRAIDIFSLGCVFFYILTQGHHPFDDDEGWMGVRERNIKANRCNLSELECLPNDLIADAKDLIGCMLSPKAEDRPTAGEVLAHPFFWSKEERLEFLSLASDRFDLEARDGTSTALARLEQEAESVIGRGPKSVTYNPSQSWDMMGMPGEPNFLSKLDQKFIDTLGKQRKYQGHKLVDLLRALRNKHHHWDDMPDDVKRKVGNLPEGYLRYWEERFPGLVVKVWRVAKDVGMSEDRRFARWFTPALA